ncbi:MAG: hypothetical protein QXP68_04495 [Thermosphaera sp.]
MKLNGGSLYWKYPFLVGLEDVLNSPYTVLPGLIGSPESPFYEKILTYFKSIIENMSLPSDDVYQDSYSEVIVFYSLGLISRVIDSTQLMNRVAVAYSKRAGTFLRTEEDDTLVEVARRIGIRVQKPLQIQLIPRVKEDRSGRKQLELDHYSYGLPLLDFVKLVVGRLEQDSSYNLASQIVHEGLVLIDRRRLVRLVEEGCYIHILTTYKSLPTLSDDKLREIKRLIEELQNILETAKWWRKSIIPRQASTEEITVVIEDAFPPCIKKIMNTVKSGGNPSHEERFNLATFLLNIGYSPDDVIALLRSTADFNEKIARYQVEHLAGMRGSKRKYKPYNCDKMKSVGMCPISGYCEGGKHPLSVYTHNAKLLEKSSKKAHEIERPRSPPDSE